MKKDDLTVVTGGAGFVGSNFVKMLNDQGNANIIIVDHLIDNGKWKNLRDLKFQDYYDREDFLQLLDTGIFDKVKNIVHLGACSSTIEKDENYLIYNNSKYSKKIFDFCVKHNIGFIYASSAATYGDGSQGYIEEVTDLKPLNCYGYSKYLFDNWVLSAAKKPIQCVGLKFFNVFGPNEYHKGFMSSAIYQGYNQIKKEGKIKLFKSYKNDIAHGDQRRDFVYIKDVVEVINFFLQNPDKSGIYNVGTGEAASYNELANSIFLALKLEPKIEFIEMPGDLKNRYQYYTKADISKLRKAGFSKQFKTLKEAICDYVDILEGKNL